MPTLADVRDALGATEPDYPRLAAELGVAAIPLLQQLVLSPKRSVAAKAVYLGALLGDAGCAISAARQPSEFVRIAAVGAAGSLSPGMAFAPGGPGAAATILRHLSNDPDPLVRGAAQRYLRAL
jgi:hypothetical protein